MQVNLSLDLDLFSLLCLATVIISFTQPHYKVTEGDGCVKVCVEFVAGQITPPDEITFTINAAALFNALSKLLALFPGLN